MPRQIPAGLNWFEAPEAAAVRAYEENVTATNLVYNQYAGLLHRDLTAARAEVDAIKAQFEASRDAAASATVSELPPELQSFSQLNAYYDDQAEAPVAAAGDEHEGSVLATENRALSDDPGSEYKSMVEGEQAESEVKLLK